MKKFLKIVLCTLGCAVLAGAAVEGLYAPRYLADKAEYPAPQTVDTDGGIRIVSANVRCFSPTDLFKKSWFYRAPLLCETVAAEQPDVIGFQEVTRLHYRYLCDRLPGYESAITYRDNSPLAEGCPIFYNTNRFVAEDRGVFWLSETPDVMSKSWGAAFNRICAYALLTDKTDGKQLLVFNTHLDHVSEQARINGIKLVLDKIKAFGSVPAVLMGDFNAVEDSETYRAATAVFDDAKYRAADTMHGATYQNWGAALDDENIDYFMISKQGVAAERYAVLQTTYDGVYPSDHFPIALRITLT